MGPWEASGIHREVVSLREGIKRVQPRISIRTVTTGYDDKPDAKALAQAVAAAQASELVVLALGEKAMDSGEASSRANPGLPAYTAGAAGTSGLGGGAGGFDFGGGSGSGGGGFLGNGAGNNLASGGRGVF